MSGHAHVTELKDPGSFEAPRLKKVSFILVAAGVVGLVVAFLTGGFERMFSTALQGMLIPTYLSLAALFYICVHSIGGAKWIVPLRRLMESLSSGLWITLGAFIVVCGVGGPFLYDWFNTSFSYEHSHLFHVHDEDASKAAFMTWPRFIIMNLVFIGLWIALRNKLVGFSLTQDAEGGNIRPRHLPWAVCFVMVFALSMTMFVWDTLLSLHVNWFSTMWGVYCFASAVQVFLCTMVLLVLWLRKGPMREHLPKHIIHDLATWMVAWSCFCAYIGFSQFMLIYYANLDEETYWYIMRTQHGYGVQYWIEAFLRWPLPFLGLMSQKVRTNPLALGIIAVLVLVGNWLDWTWIIQPAFAQNEYSSPFAFDLLAVGAGFLGGYLLLVQMFWKKHGIVAKNDPDLLPVVNAEHLH